MIKDLSDFITIHPYFSVFLVIAISEALSGLRLINIVNKAIEKKEDKE